MGLLAVACLLLAACGRPPDVGLANRLLEVMYNRLRPEWQGEALARVSRELPQYEPYLRRHFPITKGGSVRVRLAGAYAWWHFDAEAFLLLRDGMSVPDVVAKGVFFAEQAALVGDAAALESSLRHRGVSPVPLVSQGPLEAIVRGDFVGGVTQALDELSRWDDIESRMHLRRFLARVLAKNAPALRAAGLETRVFQAQYDDFLRGGSWSDYLARRAVDGHDLIHTVTVDPLISTMGSAAEYYARLGDRPHLDEWAGRMTELAAVMGRHVDVGRIEYLLAAARKIAADRGSGK